MQVDIEEYAGFGRRFAAAIIDTLFVLVLTTILQLLIFDNGTKFGPNEFRLEMNRFWIEQLFFALLFVFLWIKFLGTPGKLLMSCHVVDAITKQPLGIGQALLRYVAYYVSIIPFGLGFFWIIWDKRKQGFHDKIAGTIVIVETHRKEKDESQKSLKQLVDELR